jgi:hypothetical protein
MLLVPLGPPSTNSVSCQFDHTSMNNDNFGDKKRTLDGLKKQFFQHIHVRKSNFRLTTELCYAPRYMALL